MPDEPRRIVLVLRPLEAPARPAREEPWHGAPLPVRLRRALKLLRSVCGLECVEIREEEGGRDG